MQIRGVLTGLLMLVFAAQPVLAGQLDANDMAFAFGNNAHGAAAEAAPNALPPVVALSYAEMAQTEGEVLGLVVRGVMSLGRGIYNAYTSYQSTRKIGRAYTTVNKFVGPNAQSGRTNAGAVQVRSADNTRVVRFDLQAPKPHTNVQTFQPSRSPGRIIESSNVHVYHKR